MLGGIQLHNSLETFTRFGVFYLFRGVGFEGRRMRVGAYGGGKRDEYNLNLEDKARERKQLNLPSFPFDFLEVQVVKETTEQTD